MPEIKSPEIVTAQAETHESFLAKLKHDITGGKIVSAATPAVAVAATTTTAPAVTVATAPTTTTPPTTTAPKETLIQKVEGDAKKVWTVIEQIGDDVDKGLTVVNSYMPEAEDVAKILFPPAVAALSTVQSAISLGLNTIAEIKQKSSALPAGLSNTQMIADEAQLAGPAILALLQQEGVPSADTAYVQSLLNTLVSILQVTIPATTTSSTTSTAAA